MIEEELLKKEADNSYNEALAQCGEILGNALALKIADKECPECSKQMNCNVVPGVAIIYIYHTCVCGFKRKDFI